MTREDITQEEWIAKALAEAPPLSDRQRDIIRRLLLPAVEEKPAVKKKKLGLSSREREKLNRLFKEDPK